MAQAVEYLAEHPVLAVATTAAVLGTTAMMFRGPEPVKPPFSLSQQSVELPGPERVHVSPLCDYENGQHVITEPCFPEVQTCYEALLRGMKVSGDGPCLGWRTSFEAPFQWMSYSQVHESALTLGSALVERGCTPSNSTYIGIFSQNRPEWVIMDRACMAFSMVAVALYDTLGNEACEHIIGITEMQIIFIDKAAKLKTLQAILKESSTVKLIVLMDGPIPEEIKPDFDKLGIEIILYQDLMGIGSSNPHEPKPPSRDDVCTICFTSGTTGIPKGAIITHHNIMTSINGFRMVCKDNCWMHEGDTHLSYLPQGHQYERFISCCLMQQGARIGFFQGDIKKLLDDVQALKPTVFPSVPRLLNRIYDKVWTSVNSGSWIKRTLFNFAFNTKKAEVESGIVRNDSIWDKLVFNKIQALLGGNVKLILTGSAPLSADVIMFLRVAFGCFVSEGYAQTECTSCATLTAPGDSSAGHVGSPIPSCMIKLADVPDINYFAENNKGEVCFKGPMMFKGYLKQPEKTKEAIDEDGWLHSGDVGEWLLKTSESLSVDHKTSADGFMAKTKAGISVHSSIGLTSNEPKYTEEDYEAREASTIVHSLYFGSIENGTLRLIDRKKHIFQLSQGEYVAPEKLETIYTRLPLVAQAFIFGDSLKSCLVGIIVPDEEELVKYTAQNNLSGTFKELCQLKEVKAAILDQIVTHGKEAGLKGFELAKAIHIHDELFSAQNGLLSPTFKNKRATMADYFQDQITDMYSTL